MVSARPAKPAKPPTPPPRPPTRELLLQADQLLAAGRGGRQSSAALEQSEDDKEYQVQRQAEQRRERSFTGTWLPDVLLNAGPLVADLHEVLEPAVEPYRRMLRSLEEAARGLEDDHWAQFAQMACESVHTRDLDILGDLFSASEESWTTMLRGAVNMTFLHLGTVPMSDEMGEFWRNLRRWTGFSVAPGEPTNIGELDGIVQVLPIDSKGDMAKAFDDYAGFNPHQASDGDDSSGEQRFKLVIVDFVQEPPPKQAAQAASPAAAAAKGRGAPRTGTRRGALLPPVAGRPDAARNCTSIGQSFGIIGVTRGAAAGQRLRTLRSMISAGLHKLESKGNMVIWWGGLPGHPALLFLTRYLRDAFEKVHLLSLPGTESFEVCVLCCGFNREAVRDRPGEPRVPIGSFLNSAFRRDALDDAMLWTLTPKEAVEEALAVGNTQRTKGYDELWTLFAKKYKELELNAGGGVSGAPVKPRARGKREEKPAKKPAPRPSLPAASDDAPAGADAPAAAAGKGAGSPGASAGRGAAGRPRATVAAKGGGAGGDADAEDAGRNALDAMPLFELRALCTSRGLDAEGDRKQLTMRLEESGWGTRRFEKEQSVRKAYSRVASAPSLPSAKACMRTWHWQGSVEGFSEGDAVECFRDQPWLACSLGAAPGGHSTRGPNPMELASQFPVIRQALASMQASQQKLKDDPELWPAAVSRDKAEEQRRTRRRPPLDARLNTLRHVATGLSFRESPGTLLKRP